MADPITAPRSDALVTMPLWKVSRVPLHMHTPVRIFGKSCRERVHGVMDI